MMDIRILRQRNADLESYRDRLRANPCDGTQRVAVQITTGGSFPSGELKTYLANWMTGFDSSDIEGTSFSADIETTQTMPVVILGGPVSVGDQVVVSSVGGRWVGEIRGEGGSAPPPPCAPVSVCVSQFCSSGFPSGLPVTITNSSGTVVASGNTGSNGCVSLTLPAAGTYTFSATDAAGDVASVTTTVACGSTIPLEFTTGGWSVCANSTGPLTATFSNLVNAGVAIVIPDGDESFPLAWNSTGRFWQGSAPNDLTDPLFGFMVSVQGCNVTWSVQGVFSGQLVFTSSSCTPLNIVGTFSFVTNSGVFTGTITITL
jgi:hypothetical protein